MCVCICVCWYVCMCENRPWSCNTAVFVCVVLQHNNTISAIIVNFAQNCFLLILCLLLVLQIEHMLNVYLFTLLFYGTIYTHYFGIKRQEFGPLLVSRTSKYLTQGYILFMNCPDFHNCLVVLDEINYGILIRIFTSSDIIMWYISL